MNDAHANGSQIDDAHEHHFEGFLEFETNFDPHAWEGNQKR